MVYTPVIKHSNGKSPFSIGNTSSKGSFSIAMLDYQRVDTLMYIIAPKEAPRHQEAPQLRTEIPFPKNHVEGVFGPGYVQKKRTIYYY